MAIEVNKKKKKTNVPKGLDLFFQGMVFLFIIVTASYFFMIYLNVQAEEIKTEIEEQIEARKAEVPEKEELEKKAREYHNLIEDFKTTVSNQHIVSPFFSPFQESVHPRVTLSLLNVDLKESKIQISGEAEDFTAVGQQLYALKEKDFITSVSLNDLFAIEEDGETLYVEFSFDMEIIPELFVKTTEKND